ncbi:MAG: DegT/DnrJ/EryC1/StrS family aminotransferase, partial [Alphaproteobacteria bacterium]
MRYPYSRQQITGDDVAAVTAALTDDYLTQGPQVSAFEQEFAATVGAPHAVACNNGTAALHLAYMAAGLGPDRGLLTSPITFLATANAARMCHAPVAFADVDPLTGNLTPQTVAHAFAHTTTPIAAIATVHLGGRVSDLAGLREIADAHDCVLIEDACHAPGATYHDAEGATHGAGSGHHAHMAAFSFHAIKHIAMGEGGAVTTADPGHVAKMRALRSHGMSRQPEDWRHPPEPDAPWYYEMADLGYNYRLTDFQSALGRSQLRRLDSSLKKRRHIAAYYDQHLADIPHLTCPPQPAQTSTHAWHLYAIAIDFAALGKSRGDIIRALGDQGVGSQVHYIPLFHQPYYRQPNPRPLPGAEAYYAQTLSIPIYPQ